ncbi:LuxR C-terminal-related transcriptional regulator [Roseobacter sp.]|uniref:LuxR C-terminal-related transcriptional regulator n=1 Tax=Roseobacter sp. TaxID=1907202 RepID=UPI00385B1251
MKPRILNRQRLTDRFLSRLDRRLTLVEAPAGYGKTTLLRSWYKHLMDGGTAPTWISIDPAVENFGDALETALAGQARERVRQRQHGWQQHRAFLFIDDFHEASHFATELIGKILHRNDEGLHIVMGTRLAPTIPLAKLRLGDAVTDFGTEDLKFHRSEAETLFGDGCPQDRIHHYYNHAEGWPAALQLMLLSMAKGNALDLGSSSPAALDLGGYLNEQFLNSLSEAQNRFLLETAHLNPVNGDLADHTRQSNDSWSLLASLHQSHSLVFEQIEGGVRWYRYHQLLQDYLLRKQQSLGETSCNDLRLRAAHWLKDHGRVYAAAKLAMQAGNTGLTESIVLDAGGIEIGIRHGAQRLEPLVELFPLEWVNASPRLGLARAYLLLKAGRTGEARLLIRDARDAANSDDRELEREIVLLEVHLRLYEDRNVSAAQVAALEFTAQNTPLKDQLRRGVLYNFLCLFYIQLGELKKARSAGETAMALYSDLGCNHLIFFMHINLSVVDMDLGDCAMAYRRRKMARQVQADFFGHDTNLNAIATIVYAEAALEANEAVDLEEPLVGALQDADNREGWSEMFLAGYETCLSLKLRTGNFQDAMNLVSQGESMASRRSLPRFSRLLKILELDVAVRAGQEADARRLSGSVKALLGETGDTKGFRWRSRLLARLVLANFECQFGDPETAYDLSVAVGQDCERGGLLRYCLRALVLQVIAAVAKGDTTTAASVLAKALALGRQSGMKDAFLRDADRFAEAVRAVVRERGVAGYDPETLAFMSTLISKVQDAPDPRIMLAEMLTQKEFAVLRSLSEGHANKVIARALDLSEPTVKFHLQNVYRKLGVNSRKMAAELALQYGIRSG